MTPGVTIVIGGRVIDRVISYTVSNDMTAPADEFSVALAPVTRELYDLVRMDAEVKIYVDGTLVLSGYVDQPEAEFSKAGGSVLNVVGRDKGGRLVDESQPLATFKNRTLADIVKLCASPWFSEVRFSNAKNRGLVKGRRAPRVKSWADPRSEAEALQLRDAQESGARIILDRSPRAGIFAASKAPKKVDPGAKRWDVISDLLKPARLFAWSTADGEALVVGVPNTKQAASYRFAAMEPGGARASETNVTRLSVINSVAERYSEIVVLGAVRGDSSSYGRSVRSRIASAFDGPDVDGTGRDFIRRKKLIISDDDVKNRADAVDRATREMAVRDISRQMIEVEVPGHAQNGALYAFDTIADVEAEALGLRGRYVVTAVAFSGDKSSGPVTRISLLPEGVTLSL